MFSPPPAFISAVCQSSVRLSASSTLPLCRVLSTEDSPPPSPLPTPSLPRGRGRERIWVSDEAKGLRNIAFYSFIFPISLFSESSGRTQDAFWTGSNHPRFWPTLIFGFSIHAAGKAVHGTQSEGSSQCFLPDHLLCADLELDQSSSGTFIC